MQLRKNLYQRQDVVLILTAPVTYRERANLVLEDKEALDDMS